VNIFGIYGFCFVLLYVVPAAVFLRRLKMTADLKDLTGLAVFPQYDKDKNTVSVKNNFSDFSSGLEKKMRGNYPLTILRRVCADAENGKKYNPAFYVSLYKNHDNRFLGNLFLASHAAPLAILVLAFPFGNPPAALFLFQFVWYVLLIALQRILVRTYDVFSEVFYRSWYDKLLNFDAISISALQERLSSELLSISGAELDKTISKLKEAFSAPAEALSASNTALASAINCLSNEKQKGALVTAESVITSLETVFNRVELFRENMEKTAALQEESFKDMRKFTGAGKLTINAINTLAAEFSSLRKTLANHSSASETAAIERLAGISSALEHNVNRTFTLMEETLTTNAKELSETYGRFSDICKTLSERQDEEEA
jgi:hypothetical protein